MAAASFGRPPRCGAIVANWFTQSGTDCAWLEQTVLGENLDVCSREQVDGNRNTGVSCMPTDAMDRCNYIVPT